MKLRELKPMRFFWAVLLISVTMSSLKAQEFQHPALVNTRADLDFNNQQGEWSNVAKATATKGTSVFPDSWKLTDIGSVESAGEAAYYEGNSHNISLTSRAYAMSANGADDNFTFLYRKLTGSFTITGRIYGYNRCDGVYISGGRKIIVK